MRFLRSAALGILAATAAGAPSLMASAEVRAGSLRLHVASHDGHVYGMKIHDGISGRDLALKEVFTIVLKDGTELRSSAMQAAAIPDTGSVVDPHVAMKRTHADPSSKTSCWAFHAMSRPGKFAWCLIANPSKSYARTLLRIESGEQELPIAEVRLLEFYDAGAKTLGTVKGSPVVDQNMFFGFEHPLSANTVEQGLVKASLHRELPLRANQSVTYSAVIGTSQRGQMRRAFLGYLEAERPRAYEPFLHYNSWYDLGYQNRFDETGAIDRINEFGTHLVVERHVKLDSFLFDDGWDDSNTLWGFNSGFPDGFTKTAAAATKFHAGIGVWLSPWGGYAQQKEERIAYGKAHGFEIQNEGYALSGPKYFDRFEQICLDMVNKYHVNQFKFDGTGNADRVFPGSSFDSDFDAAIHLIERLRKEEPELFVNLTTGTTASPFWLFYADSIWRGGEDHDFSGVGDSRQRWMTYRDSQVYQNVVVKGPLFPLNSLMLHGIIYAKQAKDLSTVSGDDFSSEVHSYFGSGTQLQEMYITPALMSAANWDTLAEGARWSRANSDTLKDTHWVGGDPTKLEIYGWAAWSREEGFVTLRNPSEKAQHYQLHLVQALEDSADKAKTYRLHSVWGAVTHWPADKVQTVRGNDALDIELAPFEVITLEANVLPSASHP